MNQRERAKAVWLAMRSTNVIGTLGGYTIDLTRVLDEAQNAPPLGMSDGSLNEEEWKALRDFTVKVRELVAAFDRVTAATRRST